MKGDLRAGYSQDREPKQDGETKVAKGSAIDHINNSSSSTR